MLRREGRVDKSWWLDLAEILDALRVFPRLLLFSAFWFTCWYAYYAITTVVQMVKNVPVLADASTPEMIVQNAVAGVLGLTIPMIGNMFAKIADIYMSTGRKWDN